MNERYPDDATLLTLETDEPTGVAYIPTGRSPYYLTFRKMLYRLLRAAERANDLRVYQAGDLSIGVRAGRAYVNQAALDVRAVTDLAIEPNATVEVYLDAAGAVQARPTGLPGDRTTFVPLASVATDSTSIQTITDRRGEAFLQVPNLAMLGVTASAASLNQALDGVTSTVDAAALNQLTGGWNSTADAYHRHTLIEQDVAGEATFSVSNNSNDSAANMVIALSLPGQLPADSQLRVNADTGFLQQRYGGTRYDLVGTVHREYAHGGALTGSQTGLLVGVVPISGEVNDVILSAATNIESSDASDGASASVYVNATSLTQTDPALTAAAGAGFRSTARGEGAAASLKTDGSTQVQRGDVLTLDLTRTVNGSVTTQMRDLVVLVVMRPDRPE